jgi:hypothetical protein
MGGDERTYELRYCAFLDILGFTELIRDVGSRVEFTVVRDLLRKIHQPSTYDTAGTADFRATTISDAIALSSSFSANGLAAIIDTINSLVLSALEAGYFMRGGLCRGQLYHDNDMVFGEAFITAHRIESSIARYPRIMVTKQVYEEALGSNLWGHLQTYLSRADDGPYFVNVLEKIKMELAVIDSGSAPPEIVKRRVASFGKMREQIERRVSEAADNPNHFEKAQWFARYWNNSFPNTEHRTGHVRGPGLDIGQWRSG